MSGRKKENIIFSCPIPCMPGFKFFSKEIENLSRFRSFHDHEYESNINLTQATILRIFQNTKSLEIMEWKTDINQTTVDIQSDFLLCNKS